MMLAALALVAIVTQDNAALRAAPRESAQQQAVLWQGDSLEVRGEKMDYLQVYDHRREHGGYIRASQVRTQSLEPKDAPDLLAVVRFLRDTPGAEALGISYAAAYLKAAPAEAIGPEPFDALGTMADRLARRASAKRGKADDTVLSAHLEVASSYGIGMQGFERDGRVQLCYNGEAFRRVLAMKSNDGQRARAALALTRPECVDPNITPTERNSLDAWRADVLDRVQLTNLPEYEKNRLRLRRASVWASIAFERTRQHQPAQEAANRALQELAGVNKEEIAEPDAAAYTDAAVRVAASRWAAEPEPVSAGNGLAVVTTPGESGETCVALIDAKHDQKNPLVKRCTYGLVWKASASVNAQQSALALAVQPLDSWRELWVFHQGEKGWTIDILPPAANAPDVGYLEFAGWVPGSAKMLAVREARVDGRFKRSFEVIRMDTMDVEKQADNPRSLSLFYRWQDPAWKRGTLSMR
ncbi:SH3 domain-containing protein [Collimonas humicola]|uniref:hypothetical protein n=1 Tax=Collimonas humicola TaxID=2825886 RepID=UPI001B8B3564|nr:hypothetical protein [Collimonas humicola]